MTVSAKILLVEDDPAYRKAVGSILQLEGYTVVEAGTGRLGVKLAAAGQPDLVVLDLQLPGIGGLEVCQRLKQEPATASIPILVLTGNDREGQDVACLDMGADDYLTKPVRSDRLLAYCRALLRRAGGGKSGDLSVGSLRLRYAQKLVAVGGKEYPHLTPKEFGLLYELASKSPDPVDRPTLYKQVWGMPAPSEGSLKTVDVHVRRVRLKLGWKSDEWLRSVSGRGYCLAP